MTVGTQMASSQIDNRLSQLARALRDDCRAINDLFTQLVQAGNGNLTAGLTAAGYAPADAAVAATLLSYLNTPPQVYLGEFGQAAVGSTASSFDFDTELSVLWAGQ